MYQVFRVFSKLIKIIRFYLILNNLKNKLTVSLILSLNHATQCSFKSGKLLYVNFLEIPNVCILLLKSACICERWRTGPGKAITKFTSGLQSCCRHRVCLSAGAFRRGVDWECQSCGLSSLSLWRSSFPPISSCDIQTVLCSSSVVRSEVGFTGSSA